MLLCIRLLRLLALCFLFSILIFLIVRAMPVSPVDMLLQSMQLPLTPENRAWLAASYGLDQPLYIQYWHWICHLLQGDFGYSYLTHRPIGEELLRKLPYSLGIGLGGLALALPLALYIGYRSALSPHGTSDRISRALSLFTVTCPSFIVGLICIQLLSVQLGLVSFFREDYTAGILCSILLLGLYQCAALARIARSVYLSLPSKTYIQFYLLRGFPLPYVLWRHGMAPVVYSLLSASVSRFSTIVGSSIVLEFVFRIPGLSYFLIESITARDYLVLQAYLILLFLWMLCVQTLLRWILGYFRAQEVSHV